MKIFESRGQAVVEYIMVFAVIGLIAITMARELRNFMADQLGSMNYYLTQVLTTGVCERDCFFPRYKNQ